MTEQEAIQFVTAEIKTRYRTLNDVQFGDWVSVAMKAEYTKARAVVRELAIDPAVTLTIKAFAGRVGLGKLKHKSVSVVPHYDPCVMCLEAPVEHPDWAGRQWFTLEGFRRSDAANKDYVTQFANDAAQRTQAQEGGQWCGVIELVNNDWPERRDPQASHKAMEHVLNGPDTPGRRWLLRPQAQKGERQQITAALAETVRTVPASEPPRMATRQDLDALVERLKAQPTPARGRPNEIDWTSENLDPPRHREALSVIVGTS